MTSITSTVKFQSTPPSREATRSCDDHRWSIHISIHASLTGGDYCYGGYEHSYHISIHASLTGGDRFGLDKIAGHWNFNPRLPHGRRHIYGINCIICHKFQSTPPSREATKASYQANIDMVISIHASLTGGDGIGAITINKLMEFQSTPPSREATLQSGTSMLILLFQSTPPSREATQEHRLLSQRPHFNPRLPHGRRRLHKTHLRP